MNGKLNKIWSVCNAADGGSWHSHEKSKVLPRKIPLFFLHFYMQFKHRRRVHFLVYVYLQNGFQIGISSRKYSLLSSCSSPRNCWIYEWFQDLVWISERNFRMNDILFIFVTSWQSQRGCELMCIQKSLWPVINQFTSSESMIHRNIFFRWKFYEFSICAQLPLYRTHPEVFEIFYIFQPTRDWSCQTSQQ